MGSVEQRKMAVHEVPQAVRFACQSIQERGEAKINMDTPDIKQQVTYFHKYAYDKKTTEIPAIVVRHHPVLIRIAIYNPHARMVMYKNVKHSKLSPRTQHALIDDQFIKELAQVQSLS